MDKSTIEARLKQVERHVQNIREELSKEDTNSSIISHDAYYAGQELRQIVRDTEK